jgi:hypothetical protein
MMKSMRFEIVFGVALAAAFFVLCVWLSPGTRSRLSDREVDGYIARLQGTLPVPPDEKRRFLERLRAWAKDDDGRPVYMLNVMSYYPQLLRGPAAESVRLSPAAANAYYEDAVMPLLFRRGGYPVFAGDSAGLRTPDGTHADLVGVAGAIDGSDRILVVRYPNRRAFLDLVSDPTYLRYVPYKFAALQLALLPLEAQAIPPDPRWVAGCLALVVWFAALWWRAAHAGRTTKRPAEPEHNEE